MTLHPTEYECLLLGCDFVGTKPECEAHEAEDPTHDTFWSVPSWDELAGRSVLQAGRGGGR